MRLKILLLIIFGALMLVGCDNGIDIPFAPIAQLPDFLDNASHETRDLYRFAIANSEELTQYPCYCGCGPLGHTSVRDCFVAGLNPNGTLKYDQHASRCNLCLNIARDVLSMMRGGKSPLEIRNQIDAQYASAGPGTDTPMPAH